MDRRWILLEGGRFDCPSDADVDGAGWFSNALIQCGVISLSPFLPFRPPVGAMGLTGPLR